MELFESFQNIVSQQIVQRLGWTLVHFLWQGVAVAVLFAVALKLLKKSTANIRYLLACVAMGVIVLLPIVTLRMIDVSVPAIDIEKTEAAGLVVSGTTVIPVVESSPIETAEPAKKVAVVLPPIPLQQRFVGAIEPSLPYIVVGWFVGVFGLSIWHLGGWCQLQKMRSRNLRAVSERLQNKLKRLADALGVNRIVRIGQSALVRVPTVIGHLKPAILLPASALTGLTGEQLDAILAHELAHIKRCDYLVNILQTVIEILGFYHPAVWWVSAKIRDERENCCDDLAVTVSDDRVRYARALATMEEVRGSSLAVAASGGSLLERIRRLIGKDSTEKEKSSWLPSIIAIILLTALLIPAAFALTPKATESGNLPHMQSGQLTDTQKLVEDFFKHNYRDITARRTIEWGEPAIDTEGNMSIRYKYEATIWGKDKIIENKVWTFDKQGKFLYVRKVGAEDIYSPAGAKALVEDFFANNYRDITARETIEWGQPIKQENGNVSIRYKYKATIWGKDKIVSDESFTFGKDGKFVSVKKVGLKDVSFYKGKDPNESGISVYQVNRKVSSYPAQLDFSKPEYTFVIAKRISADGNDSAWPQISEPHLAAMMDKNKTRRSVKPKVAEEYLNTEIIEVHTKGGRASVIGRTPALIGGYNVRGFKLVDGKWFNTGEGGAITLDGARAVADQGVDYHDYQDRATQFINNIPEPNQQQAYFNSVRSAQVEVEETKADLQQKVDITAGDFKIRTNNRGVKNLVVSIKNDGDIVIPEFKLRYYRGDVENNLDEVGNTHNGWHGAGPIEPGKQWNERTRDFHLPDGEYEFSVVLDYDNAISETDENNNTASIKVVIKDGQIKSSEPHVQVEGELNEDVILAFNELIKAVRENNSVELRKIANEQAEAFKFGNEEKQNMFDTLQLDAKALRTYEGIENLEISTIEKKGSLTNVLTSRVTDARGVGGRFLFRFFGKEKIVLEGISFITDMGTKLILRPQVLTSGYILSVPSDLPQLKEIISDDKSKTKMITPEELEEFLNVIKTIPEARIISSPKILTNDGEVGEIRTENAQIFGSVEIRIKNSVQPDRKTITLELDFEHILNDSEDHKTISNNVSTKVTLFSEHAIAVAGGVDNNGQTILLLVTPEILEAKTVNIPQQSDVSDEEEKQIEIEAWFLFFDEGVLERIMTDPNAKRVTAGGDANRPSSIIDDDATSFIMRATKIYENSKMLTPPKVTVLDGETAYISITKGTAYIADYNEPKAKGLLAIFAKPEPIVKNVNSGIELKVLPKLIDDGQNILLDVDFSHTNVLSMENYTYKKGEYPLQIPETESVGIESRVVIPDGGTLVLGGQEITTKDKSGVEQKRSLLVLIKAKIVDTQKEDAKREK